ncbi:MAG: hypothetical protein K2O34_03100, partial [Acetatifactor sp.]|nr:hypothetical protein [Acetatifactor sp.]
MAKQKRRITASFVAVMLLISVILSGCGQKPQDVPADADVSSVVESSEVESTEESQAEEAQPQPTEEPAPTEEPEVTLSGTYLFELEQGDNLEFKYSDYNSDYKVGNRITISVEMESAGAFNGCLGTNVGSNYDWQQEDYDSQAGSHTLTWTVTPSLDQAQLSVWYAENAPVGIVSIDVTIEEVEPAVIGNLATFTEQDTYEFPI